jgi:hypothetical protein
MPSPFPKTTVELGFLTPGDVVQFREREPYDTARGAQPKMAVFIFDGSVDEKRCNSAVCRERGYAFLM